MRMCYKKKNKIVKKISLNYFYKIRNQNLMISQKLFNLVQIPKIV